MITENKISLGKIIVTFIYILIFPVVLLLLAGDWLWVEGLIFSVWFLVLCYTTIIYLYHKDPSLLLERYQQPGTANQKGWDKYVVIGLVIGFITWIVIMPLDAKRFGWTTYHSLWLKILGGIGLILSFFFFLRSYTDNTFLSPLVRIQSERMHQVISTGVYGFVRHPMYLGGSLLFIGTPMLLGSTYGLLLGFLVMLLLVFRIVGEEKMLINELEGYNEYKNKVKYRLIPFIW
ncbi:MAG: isoprenylcysteine carboxylmethyltransferase family protein [Bacteroidales bacterium]|nr:isoprenylcysteine carboxylmethyltransferase family protein [Bacteroidales bacterium]